MTAAPSTDEAPKAKYEVALEGDKDKKPMLLNVEVGVKKLIAALAGKTDEDAINLEELGINPEAYKEYPNSITGVCMYLMTSALKAELDIAFDEAPKSIRQRGGSNMDKKVAGKKRLLTKEQKNELLDKTKMSHYEARIATGLISIEEAMASIKEAFTKKQEYEAMGYVLPAAKTKPPHWKKDDAEEVETSEA